MKEFSHLDSTGRAKMVDVSAKDNSVRRATASAIILLSAETIAALRGKKNPKGDPLEVARIAGIMAAKKTAELIPMCHPINLTDANVAIEITSWGIRVVAETATVAPTGVEMEALTAAAAAALTIYDMCKSIQPDIVISDIRLESKTGGKSDFRRSD